MLVDLWKVEYFQFNILRLRTAYIYGDTFVEVLEKAKELVEGDLTLIGSIQMADQELFLNDKLVDGELSKYNNDLSK